MPTCTPTGFETNIYDHKQFPHSNEDTRQYLGVLHNPELLPPPKSDSDSTPLIMIEPSYASGSNDVFIHIRYGHSFTFPRSIAEQLRDALIKVCEKPIHEQTNT